MSPSKNSAEPLTPKSNRVPGSFPTDPISPGQQAQRNLAREVFERRDEYVKTQRFKIKIGSWNVAALPGTSRDLGAWFAQGKGVSQSLGGIGTKQDEARKQRIYDVEKVVEQEKRQTPLASTVPKNDPGDLPHAKDIDIYVLGLQEIVDINSAAEALRPFNDPHPSRLWKETVAEALPKGYELVAEQQLIGLLLLVYASPKIAKTVSSVSTTHVGTGLMGYMGNKGAVAARLVLGEKTKFIFVNSHLGAGSDKTSLERRNWDFSQIMQRVRFDPIDHGYGLVEEVGDGIGDEDFAFWFGDLNYRLDDIPGGDVRRLLLLHTRNEYDSKQASLNTIADELQSEQSESEVKENSMSSGNPRSSDTFSEATTAAEEEEVLDPSQDPASLQTTLISLLPHDQLHEQMRTRKAFAEGWREGPIKFLPTYKYDVGSVGMLDSSEKKRAPSWCDRILFRTRNDFVQYQQQRRDQEEARKRDQEMKERGLENGPDEVIFDYDPETDGGDDDYDEHAEEDGDTLNGANESNVTQDRISLEYYTSHQRVLSSDHKPLDALFSIEYDAIDPERKALIHQEVAREIDRAENEGRPAVTVIFDNNSPTTTQGEGCFFGDLRFREEKTITMTLANTSPVTSTFSYLAKEGLETTPSWLRLVFHHDITQGKVNKRPAIDIPLEPGETTSVDVIAQVIHPSDLIAFNEGTSKPDDILILRVRDGRDHFIPVQAHWQRSCFGLSLDRLIELPKGGARSLSWDKSPDMDSQPIRSSAPHEFFRLTEALEENLNAAVAECNDYSVSEIGQVGWPFTHVTHGFSTSESTQHASTLLSIRDALDTNSAIEFPIPLVPTTRTTILAQTLLLFLSCMPGRIISQGVWATLSVSLAEHEKSKRPPLAGEDLRTHILDILSASPVRSVSFTFLTFMLQRIIDRLAGLDVTSKDAKEVSSPLSPKSPEILLKRARGMSLSVDSRAVRSRDIGNAYLELFLPLVFEEDEEKGAKARKVETERKKIVLESFLRSTHV